MRVSIGCVKDTSITTRSVAVFFVPDEHTRYVAVSAGCIVSPRYAQLLELIRDCDKPPGGLSIVSRGSCGYICVVVFVCVNIHGDIMLRLVYCAVRITPR